MNPKIRPDNPQDWEITDKLIAAGLESVPRPLITPEQLEAAMRGERVKMTDQQRRVCRMGPPKAEDVPRTLSIEECEPGKEVEYWPVGASLPRRARIDAVTKRDRVKITYTVLGRCAREIPAYTTPNRLRPKRSDDATRV